MASSNLSSRLYRELSVLTTVNSSSRPWHLPLLAATTISLPIFLGAMMGELALGIQASLGAMIILNLPSSGSLWSRQVTLIWCALAMSASFGLGLLSHDLPSIRLPVFALITWCLVVAGRYWRLPPPAGLFMMMAGAIALFMPVTWAQIPEKVAVLASGSALAWSMALLYNLTLLLTANKEPETHPVKTSGLKSNVVNGSAVNAKGDKARAVKAKDTQSATASASPQIGYQQGLWIESLIVTLFVVLALAVGLALKLSQPYWVPVSCFIIMQGMHLRTMWIKQLHRLLGTTIGVGVAWGLLALSLPPVGVAIAIFWMMLWIETMIVRHYGLAVIFITPLTIFIAEYGSGHALMGTAAQAQGAYQALMTSRLLDTALGCMIALLGGLLMHSTWVRERVLAVELSLVRRFSPAKPDQS